MFFNRRLSIWPTLPLNVFFRKKSSWVPFPLDQQNCRVFSLARHAIWSACKQLKFGENDIILVPAYHHGSEIESLLQAGLKIRYYELDDNLQPDINELNARMGPDVKALYIIHYLGFPQDAAFWRKWCDEKGILLFEDAAQAFLSSIGDRPVGSFGHVSVFCLYKTYGIPDGGAIVSIDPPPVPQNNPTSGGWRVFKRNFNWVAERVGLVGGIHLFLSPYIREWKKATSKPHAEFDLKDPQSRPADLTMSLMPKLADKGTAQQRRDNYHFLLKELKDYVPAPFATLPEGACPFAFPMELSNAREFLAEVQKDGIIGLLFWINPHPSLPVEEFPRARALREKVLALPVHQELTRGELNQIVHAAKRALRK